MNFKKLQILILIFLCQFGVENSPVFSQMPAFNWAKNFGGYDSLRSDVSISAMTTDTFGNVYAIGSFSCDSVDLDPGPGVANLVPLSSGGLYSNDLFVFKLDALGNYVWAKPLGGIENEAAYKICVDNSGYLYFTGRFATTMDMDPGPGVENLTAAGGVDVFVCKWDTTGSFTWARKLGGFGYDEPRDMTVDNDGNVYITGGFTDTADFDPGAGVAKLGSSFGYDIFICKLNSAGDYQWARSIGGMNYVDFGQGVAADDNGNVYFTGVFSDTVDFDPGTGTEILSTSGPLDHDIFVCKLDINGDYVWAKQFGGVGDGSTDGGHSIALDTSGVYVLGVFAQVVDFDPGPGVANLTSFGEVDIFICKLDASGNYRWAGNMGGSEGEWGNVAHGITMDNLGNSIYLMFGFTGNADIDPGTGTYNVDAKSRMGEIGERDVAIVRLCPSGNFIWGGAIGSYDSDGVGCMSVSSGDIYVSGTYLDTFDVDLTEDSFFVYPTGLILSSSLPGRNSFISKALNTDTALSILNIDTCAPTFVFHGRTFSTSGSYDINFLNESGCDSLVTLNLTISEIEPEITIDEYVLGTTLTYESYQWLLNGMPISGATDSTYTVLENGDYQVVVMDGPCIDTSAVYTVNNVNISDRNGFDQLVRIYPNPAQHIVYIQTPVQVDVVLMSIEGRIIRKVNHAKSIDVADLAAGVYLLKITDTRGVEVKVERLVKQK